MNRTEELIAMCKLGNTSGYTGLYNDHSQAVYNTILRLVGHSGEAEDYSAGKFCGGLSADRPVYYDRRFPGMGQKNSHQ
jgi:hypothetical protein